MYSPQVFLIDPFPQPRANGPNTSNLIFVSLVTVQYLLTSKGSFSFTETHRFLSINSDSNIHSNNKLKNAHRRPSSEVNERDEPDRDVGRFCTVLWLSSDRQRNKTRSV